MNQIKIGAVALGALLIAGAAAPSGAVVLRSKWTAGQELSYSVQLDGNATLKAGAPGSMFAGIPIQIDQHLTGEVVLNTLAVDSQGVGTLQPRIDAMQFKAGAMGQQGMVTIKNGSAQVQLNGGAMSGPSDEEVQKWTEPAAALRISPLGHFEGITPVGAGVAPMAGTAVPARVVPVADDNAQPTPEAGAAKRGPAMMLAMLSRVLPALWPEHDVTVGNIWSAQIASLLPPVTDADGTVHPAPAPGKFDFKLEGDDTTNGRKTQRVSVEGTIKLNMASLPHGLTPDNKIQAQMGGFNQSEQRIDGELWLDPDAGQLVRAELNIEVQAAGGGAATPAATRPATPQNWFDYNGAMVLQLDRTGTAAAPAAN